jgi:hypothetical protein
LEGCEYGACATISRVIIEYISPDQAVMTALSTLTASLGNPATFHVLPKRQYQTRDETGGLHNTPDKDRIAHNAGERIISGKRKLTGSECEPPLLDASFSERPSEYAQISETNHLMEYIGCKKGAVLRDYCSR